MTGRFTVRVRERGRTPVAPEVWHELVADPDFWSLVESGVVGVSQISRGRFALRGTRYVGRAACGLIDLEVHEKVPGVLQALIAFASDEAFRVEQIEGPETDFGALTGLLVHQFVVAVKGYVSGGRDFHYGRHGTVSALVRGKLDVVKSIRLRAKGMGHLIAFDQVEIVHDIEKNRVVLRALREVESLARLIPISGPDLAGARTMAILFSDCRNIDVLFGSRRSWAMRAEAVAWRQDRDDHRDMLALAGVLLAHRGFETEQAHVGRSPRAWFLNLEELFETAVRRTVARLVAQPWSVANGKLLRVPIFRKTDQIYRANPDLVLQRRGRVVVGDVKHKDWQGDTAHAEVYQLLVHARTYQASEAFLVFPGDELIEHDLGVSSVGIRVRLFAVDARRLADHLGEVLTRVGIPRALGPALRAASGS